MEKGENSKKIIVAQNAGFCFGVRRAVDMAKKALKKKNGRVLCLGEIIHNPRVIADLEKKGMKTIENVEEIEKGDMVIIRSHGVAPDVVEKIKEKGAEVMDTTCPFVKKAQKTAMDFEKEDRQVIIFGDPKHPEVVGIEGGTKNGLVVQNEEEAERMGIFSKIGFLAQTTQKLDIFEKIKERFASYCGDLKVENTICLDSFNKKDEVKKIAKDVEVMIVVGGKNSNNTKKLAEVSKSVGAKTFHIENSDELKKEWFLKASKIGLAAGASTPDESIKEVRKQIEKFD